MFTEEIGPFTLCVPEGCFPLGEDSLALGGFAGVRRGEAVCDLGCGCGTLLLLLARREPALALSGIELDPRAAQAARDNLARNGLRGAVVTGDLRDRSLLPNEGFELVLSNPPYFSKGSGPSGGTARSEEACTLDELCAAAGRILKNGGRFSLVHRPERLTDLLCTLRARRLEPKRLQFAVHGPGRAPSAVLLEGVKNGRPGLTVLPERLRGA